MAKGARGGKRNSADGVLNVSGQTLEFNGKLNYTGLDPAIPSDKRTVLEAWELKRVGSKVEYGTAIGINGVSLGEKRGGKGSVRTPYWWHDDPNVVFSHIHPREDGALGGTFSYGDIKSWAVLNGNTMRASAKEGTYSITKGKNFDAKGMLKYARSIERKFETNLKADLNAVKSDYYANKLTRNEFQKAWVKAANTRLVEYHNDFLAGQKQYGYNYYLEKR